MRVFANRDEAGKLLGERLRALEISRPIVLGIPRGGIPIAVSVAGELPDAELGVVVARKLGAPWRPELAIGAVTANGSYYLDDTLARDVGASSEYVNEVLRSEREEARRREERFDGRRSPPVAGRNVILVDDGVATGATAIASIRAMKAAGVRSVVFAVPVGPSATLKELRSEADEVVCLSEPEDFGAAGQFYVDFRPVMDEQAKQLLDSFQSREQALVEEGVSDAGRRYQ